MEIFDIDRTAALLSKALAYYKEVVDRGGKVLFVGTHKESIRGEMESKCLEMQMPYFNHRCPGGFLTNMGAVRRSVHKYRALVEMRDGNNFEHLTKKESMMNLKLISKLERTIGGVVDLKTAPDLVILLSAKHSQNILREAKALNLTVIAVVDSNCSPEHIAFPIPGNDDGLKALYALPGTL